MPRHGTPDIFCIVDGYDYAAVLKARNVELEAAAEQEDVTTFGDDSKKFDPTGLSAIEAAVAGGFFDSAAGQSHAALAGAPPTSPATAARIMVVGYAGDVQDKPFIGIEGLHHDTYKPIANVGPLVKADVGSRATGALDHGIILQPLQQQSADWDTESTSHDENDSPLTRAIVVTSSSVANPSVITTPVPHGLTSGDVVVIVGHSGSTPAVDGEHTVTVLTTTTFTIVLNVTTGGTGGTVKKVDSSNGGVAYMEVTEATTVSAFIGTIRHSSDDAAWSDHTAFPDNVSAPYGARLVLAGQIDRYTAFKGDGTGFGTITAWAGLHRNP